ncbi:MAG: hypothetical protein IJK93_05885 [Muribaculaceae bacterium]|nr:hypothetical protein [Muribaculaceae bacterium]
MRYLIFLFGVMLSMSFFACTGSSDTGTVPEEDTITVDTAVQVTGVAIDGAMNSVYLKVGEDTVEFSYPDLDSDKRASWEINDTLTVRYYVTENGDSVAEVINETA